MDFKGLVLWEYYSRYEEKSNILKEFAYGKNKKNLL